MTIFFAIFHLLQSGMLINFSDKFYISYKSLGTKNVKCQPNTS